MTFLERSASQVVGDASLRVVEIPFSKQPYRALRVLLPQTCVAHSNLSCDLGGVTFATFCCPKHDISFTFAEHVLLYELDLEDWLIWRLETEHLIIVDKTPPLQFALASVGDSVDKPTRTIVICQNEIVYHIAVIADGRSVVSLVAMSRFPGTGVAQQIADHSMNSISIRPVSNALHIETLLRYTFPNNGFAFCYPKSWTILIRDEFAPTKYAVDLTMANDEDIEGYLRIACDSDRSPQGKSKQNVFKIAIEEIESSGFVVTRNDLASAGNAQDEVSGRFHPRAQPTAPDADFHILARRRDEFWLTITAMFPKRSLNPLAWMRARRACRLIAAEFDSY